MHRLVQRRKYSPSFVGKIVVSYRFMSEWKAFTPMIEYVMMGGAQLTGSYNTGTVYECGTNNGRGFIKGTKFSKDSACVER